MDLKNIIYNSKYLKETLSFLSHYNHEKVYVVAGAVTQTVWNYLFKNDLGYGIDDLDLIYFNDKDLSENHENAIANEIRQGLRQIDLRLDIKNQARVHMWYQDKFGYEIEPIQSIEDSIDRFPTTVTSIAIRHDNVTGLRVYAPFGLDDLFAGVVRPNKKQVTETIYNEKVDKWIKKWPGLKVIKW